MAKDLLAAGTVQWFEIDTEKVGAAAAVQNQPAIAITDRDRDPGEARGQAAMEVVP